MPPRTMPRGFLTEREAAQMVGVSPMTLRNHAEKFNILFYRTDGGGMRRRMIYRRGSVLRHADDVRDYVGTRDERAGAGRRAYCRTVNERIEREVQKRIAGREIQPLPKPKELPPVATRRNTEAAAQRNRLIYLLAEYGGLRHAEVAKHIGIARERIRQIVAAEALVIDRARRAQEQDGK